MRTTMYAGRQELFVDLEPDDVIVINGHAFSGEFFTGLLRDIPVGTLVCLLSRADGTITLAKVHDEPPDQ